MTLGHVSSLTAKIRSLLASYHSSLGWVWSPGDTAASQTQYGLPLNRSTSPSGLARPPHLSSAAGVILCQKAGDIL